MKCSLSQLVQARLYCGLDPPRAIVCGKSLGMHAASRRHSEAVVPLMAQLLNLFGHDFHSTADDMYHALFSTDYVQ